MPSVLNEKFSHLLDIPELPKELKICKGFDFQAFHECLIEEVKRRIDAELPVAVDEVEDTDNIHLNWLRRATDHEYWFKYRLPATLKTIRASAHVHLIDTHRSSYISSWRPVMEQARTVFEIRGLQVQMRAATKKLDDNRIRKFVQSFNTFQQRIVMADTEVDKIYNKWAKAIGLDNSAAEQYKDKVMRVIYDIDYDSQNWKSIITSKLESALASSESEGAKRIHEALEDELFSDLVSESLSKSDCKAYSDLVDGMRYWSKIHLLLGSISQKITKPADDDDAEKRLSESLNVLSDGSLVKKKRERRATYAELEAEGSEARKKLKVGN